MKVKRIISALAALAMSVSCLAGLTITTSAAESVLTQDFSSDSLASAQWWLITGENSDNKLLAKADDEYLHITNTASGGRTSDEIKLGGDSAITTDDAKNVRVKVDFKGDNSKNANGDPFRFVLTDGSGKEVFSLGLPAHRTVTAKVTVNGADTDIELAQQTELSEWYTITAVLDFDSHKVNYSIAKKSAAGNALSTGTVDMTDTSVTTVGGIKYQANRPSSKGTPDSFMDLDNFSLEKLVTPTITMSEDPVTIADTSGEQTVDCTVANAKAEGGVTVETDDENDVLQATYDQNKITLKGQGKNGVVNVTVIAESDDGIKVSKTINVTVGTVVKKDVTVKFVEQGGTTPVTDKDEVLFSQAAKDSEITKQMIEEKSPSYESDHITNDKSAKYTYVSTSPALPYTVTDSEDQIIYVYYVKHDRVNPLTLNYTGTDSKTEEITYGDENAKYIGDEVTYSYPKYVTDEGNKVTHEYAGDDNKFTKTVTLTSDTENISYKAHDGNSMWAVEAETAITASNALKGNTTGITDTTLISNGNGVRRLNSSFAAGETGVQLFTVPENGKYKITLRAAFTNAKTGTFTLYNGAKNAEPSVTIGTTDTINKDVADHVVKSGEVEEFALKKGDVIYIEGDSDNAFLDLATFEKTADLEPESKPVAENPTVLGSITKPDGVTDELDTYAAEMKVKTISIVIPDSESEVPKLSVQNYNGGAEFDPGWVAVTSGGSRIFYVQFRAADFAALGTVKATYGGKDIAISLAD